MSITIEQAKQLTYRTEIHHKLKNADGKTCMVFRINGKIKLWKTRPNDFSIPIKRGLWEYHYLDHTNCNDFHLIEDCHYCTIPNCPICSKQANP